MLSIKPKKANVIGLDISSTSVKLLELSQSAKGYKVESYAMAPLPANAVSEKNITDVQAVGETIQQVIKRSGTKVKHAALAVAGSAVITKVINMPAGMNETEMETQIEIEADQYIPYPLEEVNIHFEILGPTEGNPDSVDVLLAASRSENVEMRVAAAEIGGLTTKVVDVESYSLETVFPLLRNSIPPEAQDGVVAIIDIGHTMTSLSVLEHGHLIYTREQEFGGSQLTEDIMRRYSLSYEEAGKAKKLGGLPDNYSSEVLEPFKENMIQQASRFLQFFFSAGQYSHVDHVILAGGCAAIPGVDDMLAENIGTSVTIANPFTHMSLSNRVKTDMLNNDAPSLIIATGLAMRSFD